MLPKNISKERIVAWFYFVKSSYYALFCCFVLFGKSEEMLLRMPLLYQTYCEAILGDENGLFPQSMGRHTQFW
jgi:hypothetical protein